MDILGREFYQGEDVVAIAKATIGKYIYTIIDDIPTAAMIIECEAYSYKEKGCHAYGAKKTKRNAAMFEEGGVSYVYLCYGIHEMFNIVTNRGGYAEAILVRAIKPIVGEDIMKSRRGSPSYNGPGKVTQALGIHRSHNNMPLFIGNTIWLTEGKNIADANILESPRIGIDYAAEDALLPWRFTLKS